MVTSPVNYKAIDWTHLFVYDETSKSCLKWKINYGWTGTYFVNVCGQDVGGFNDPKSDKISGKYYKVNVHKKKHYVHRIIWELLTGIEIPDGFIINHIDCNPSNNKIENLELCKREDNNRRCKNHKAGGFISTSKTKINGVVFRNTQFGGRWIAHWTSDGKLKTKSFAVSVFGDELAKILALQEREKQISILIDKGVGYTKEESIE